MRELQPTKRNQKIAQKLLTRLLQKRAELIALPSERVRLKAKALKRSARILLELDAPGKGQDPKAVQRFIRNVGGHLDRKAVLALEEAERIAGEFNLPATDAGLARLFRWLLLIPPTLEEVMPYASPVRLYWAKGSYVINHNELDKIGKAELWDFIRPGHIYLDVTLAVKQDLTSVMGRRRSKTEIRNEALERFSEVRSAVQMRPGEASRVRIQAELERRGIRTDRNRIAEQENRIAEEFLLEQVRANPDLFWLAPEESPRTVSEIQDLKEIAQMGELLERPGRKVAKAGRAKGEPRPHRKWLNDLTLPQVIDHLHQYPEELEKTEQAYLQFRVERARQAKRASLNKAEALKLGMKDPLDWETRRQIEKRARANFRNQVRLPLKRESTKR